MRTRDAEPQKALQNSSRQYANVRDAFQVAAQVPAGPVLLIDDLVDSRWTLTAAGAQLLASGSGPVYPFALADTTGRAAD